VDLASPPQTTRRNRTGQQGCLIFFPIPEIHRTGEGLA
jgi:hypothetical protein